MLCSISTGKSGSTWLDRLRTSKGFPVQTGLDLEHFLNPNPNVKIPNTPTAEEKPSGPNPNPSINDEKSTADRKKKTLSIPISPAIAENSNEDWFDIMSSVLSELFNMGDSSRIRALESRKKKSSRKQHNPKICTLSTSASVDDSCLAGAPPAMSPSSADNSIAEGKESRKQGIPESVNPEDEILQAITVDSDLSAFSRAEVTIIDTSAPVWKSEKLIYRKGTVWKIKDKKRSSWNASACRKKRKLGQRDGNGGEEKQGESSLLSLSNAVKEAGRGEHFMSSNEVPVHIDKREPSKEIAENLAQIPERRQQFSRSPRKPATKDSPVFLAQCIPVSRKSDSHGQKTRLKGLQ